jgi:hypothetical protein
MQSAKAARLGLRLAVMFGCGGLVVACTGGPTEPAPVILGTASPTDIAGPVDAGSPGFARPLPRPRSAARHAPDATRHNAARVPPRHLASLSERHRSPLKEAATHKPAARKHAKHVAAAKVPRAGTGDVIPLDPPRSSGKKAPGRSASSWVSPGPSAQRLQD